MSPRYLLISAAVIAAALAGFAIARLTTPSAAPAAAAAPETPPQALVLSPDAIRDAAIALETVSPGGLAAEILAQGAVVSAPSGQAVLTARATGAILRIYKRLGDSVTAGETVALIDSPDAARLVADRTAADARARLARQTLAREKSLFDQGITPRAAYEQAQAEAEATNAEAARAATAARQSAVSGDGRSVRVISPITGHITAAPASLGAFIAPDTELFRVADTRQAQVEAAVSAADAPRLAAGDRAVIETEDQAFEGRVRAITPALDPHSRTATAVIDIANAPLQPGRGVRLRLWPTNATATTAIVVPEDAVQSLDGRDIVFVRTPDGFRAQPVVTGPRSAGRIEIVSGLTPGVAVATRNAFVLKAELGKSAGEE